MLPIVREFLQLVLRANLMFFYFEGDFSGSNIAVPFRLGIEWKLYSHFFFFFSGLYYHISKRTAGIRYVFIGKPTNQRPR